MKLLLFCFGLSLTVAAAAPQNNVLFIAIDDLRPELGVYGHKAVKSPNIDRLAASGLVFDRAYCQLALCNPSRSSLLSGKRPETIKIYTLAAFLRDKNQDLVTLPQHFKESGYETRSYGKIFHSGNGNHDDLASWSIRPWHSPSDNKPAVTRAAKKAARKAASASDPDSPDHSGELPYGDPDVAENQLIDGQICSEAITALGQMKDKPFFLAVGFHRPHLPFVAPRKFWDLYSPAEIRLAPNPFLPIGAPAFASNDASELRRYKGVPPSGPISDTEALRLIHGYYACISYVDAQVGRLLAELDRLGLRERTVIVLWGDHGYQLGEHGTWTKRTDWEIATRVPLIVSSPGMAVRGEKTRALVEFVDIYPSLVELCGLQIPAGLEGTSFVPLLKDPNQPWKTAAFSIYTKQTPELGKTFGRAMRTDQYRFIEWSGSSSQKKIFELYDHSVDPLENTNLAVLPENQPLVEKLSLQLSKGWQGALPPSASP